MTEGHALFCTLSTSGLFPFANRCLPRTLLRTFLFSGYSWYDVIKWVVDNPHALDFGRASWQMNLKVTICVVEASRWTRTREAAHCRQVLELHNMNQFSSLRSLRSYMCDTPIAPIFMTSEFENRLTA